MATSEATAVQTVRVLSDEEFGSHLITASFEVWQETVQGLREQGKEGATQADAVTSLLRSSGVEPIPGNMIEIEIMPSTESDALVDALQSAMQDSTTADVEIEYGDYKRKARTGRAPKASANGSGEKAPRSGGKKKGTPKECACGCGEMTGGGNFRPGHDARHKGNLLRAIDEGGPSGEAALEELRKHPNLTNIKDAEARLGSGPAKEAAKKAREAERLAALKAKKASDTGSESGDTEVVEGVEASAS